MSILDIESPHEKASLENNRHEQHYHCEHGQTLSSGRSCWHNIRLRRLLLPGIMMLAGLLLAWSCINWYGWGTWSDNLVRRGLSENHKGQ